MDGAAIVGAPVSSDRGAREWPRVIVAQALEQHLPITSSAGPSRSATFSRSCAISRSTRSAARRRGAGAALPRRPDRRRCRRQPDARGGDRQRVCGDAAPAAAIAMRASCSTAGARVSPARRSRGASTIDALDAHDGHVLTKGHAGAAILPALLAVIDGAQARRARRSSRRPRVPDVPRARVRNRDARRDRAARERWPTTTAPARGTRSAARRSPRDCSRFDAARSRHALGVAEYFGPRGQILRVRAIRRRW